MTEAVLQFGKTALRIEDIVAIAQGQRVALSDEEGFRARLSASYDLLHKVLSEDGVIYGVTTGYGDRCDTAVPEELLHQLPIHLSRYHGCGLGDLFSATETRAIIAARIASLCQGYSAVSTPLIERLVVMLEQDMLPLIPQEGSVGASGDLTPLSYVCAALIGEREVAYKGAQIPAAKALATMGLDPIVLQPKEALAIMNGTSVMTALACLAYKKAAYLSRLAARISSLCSLSLLGNSHHFDEHLFQAKPHRGQAQVAAWISQDLNSDNPPRNEQRLQDRYSIRCAPHVIGVLNDSLPWMRQFIETELNSATDNPIIDPEQQAIYHGGHFYGGHIAMAMDSLKNAVANIADLMDRQFALLVDPKMNNGLAPNITAATGKHIAINHGFKAVQIACSAWTAEALKLTMPASVFSRSTESHNQDKVSMGTISARDCLRILTLTEQCAAAVLCAAQHGLALRLQAGSIQEASLQPDLLTQHRAFMQSYPLLTADRALEHELRDIVEKIHAEHWPLYTSDAE